MKRNLLLSIALLFSVSLINPENNLNKSIINKIKDKEIPITEIYVFSKEYKYVEKTNIVYLFNKMPINDLSNELYNSYGLNIDNKLLISDLNEDNIKNYEVGKKVDDFYISRWTNKTDLKYSIILHVAILKDKKIDFTVYVNTKVSSKSKNLIKYKSRIIEWITDYASLDLKSNNIEESSTNESKNIKYVDFNKLKTKDNIRGIKYSDKKYVDINNLFKINIPSSWSIDIKEKPDSKLNYLLCSIQSALPEFSNLILIYVIPNDVKEYNEVVTDSLTNDFLNSKYKDFFPLAKEKIGANEVKTYFGKANKIGDMVPPGNLISAYYYDDKNKVTIKLIFHLTYVKNFNNKEWESVIFNSAKIMDSLIIN